MLELPNDLTEDLSPEAQAVHQRLMSGLCSVQALAAAIGRSEQSVKLYIRKGLPHVRVGKTPFVIVDSAREWFASRGNQDVPTAEL